jgi:hypothetical protein
MSSAPAVMADPPTNAFKKGGKVKGFAGGGRTSSKYDGSIIDDDVERAARAAPDTDETDRRYRSARKAMTSAIHNQQSPEVQDTYKYRPLFDDIDLEHARANYPGFKCGGKVTATAHRAAFAAKRKK